MAPQNLVPTPTFDVPEVWARVRGARMGGGKEGQRGEETGQELKLD